jgi:MoxR-like ATPase
LLWETSARKPIKPIERSDAATCKSSEEWAMNSYAELSQAREVSQIFIDQVRQVRDQLHQVIVGQDEVLDELMVCALTGSHALLVGVPGLAKTLMVKTLASAFHWRYSRVQFTPDLMPSDITGYELLGRDPLNGEMKMQFRRGPVFANLVLADEINRAAPKTQSALLEAMAERHVTVGGETYLLEEPFLVVATQNPIEQEGTYPLPEAQLDRFMMDIRVGYPTPEQEKQIVRATTAEPLELPDSRLTREDFLRLRSIVRQVPVPDSVVDYAVSLCGRTRPESAGCSQQVRDYVAFGAGPRGSQNMVLAAKARALLEGRTAPIVEDVQRVAMPILRHRLILNHRAIGDNYTVSDLIGSLLKSTPILAAAG